ncbi:MAG TPA: hypothetical protein VGM82_11225 [Gemmatimonadaceae bacterium]
MATLSGERGKFIKAAGEPGAVAAFDSLPVGTYTVRVQCIGYTAANATVIVKDGCRTGIEAYLYAQKIGLSEYVPGQLPPQPRVVIRTC